MLGFCRGCPPSVISWFPLVKGLQTTSLVSPHSPSPTRPRPVISFRFSNTFRLLFLFSSDGLIQTRFPFPPLYCSFLGGHPGRPFPPPRAGPLLKVQTPPRLNPFSPPGGVVKRWNFFPRVNPNVLSPPPWRSKVTKARAVPLSPSCLLFLFVPPRQSFSPPDPPRFSPPPSVVVCPPHSAESFTLVTEILLGLSGWFSFLIPYDPPNPQQDQTSPYCLKDYPTRKTKGPY